MNSNYKHSEITDKIIRAFYNVYNKLGYGFLEKVYERSLVIELRKLNLHCESQYPIDVYYENEVVGKYYADILVENSVIIELKADKNICPEHEAQLLNYLKATNIEVGLLLNFGEKPQLKRKVYSNEFKSEDNHKKS